LSCLRAMSVQSGMVTLPRFPGGMMASVCQTEAIEREEVAARLAAPLHELGDCRWEESGQTEGMAHSNPLDDKCPSALTTKRFAIVDPITGKHIKLEVVVPLSRTKPTMLSLEEIDGSTVVYPEPEASCDQSSLETLAPEDSQISPSIIQVASCAEVFGSNCIRAVWHITGVSKKLAASQGKSLVSPPFEVPGVRNLRLVVCPYMHEGKAATRGRKGRYIAMVNKGPLYGSLTLKAADGCVELRFYLTVGSIRCGPFTHDFSHHPLYSCNSFGVDWLQQVECGCLRVGLEILEVRCKVKNVEDSIAPHNHQKSSALDFLLGVSAPVDPLEQDASLDCLAFDPNAQRHVSSPLFESLDLSALPGTPLSCGSDASTSDELSPRADHVAPHAMPLDKAIQIWRAATAEGMHLADRPANHELWPFSTFAKKSNVIMACGGFLSGSPGAQRTGDDATQALVFQQENTDFSGVRRAGGQKDDIQGARAYADKGTSEPVPTDNDRHSINISVSNGPSQEAPVSATMQRLSMFPAAAAKRSIGIYESVRRLGGRSLLLRRFDVGIEQDHAFRVVRRLLGPGGRNMKHIAAESAGARLTIRGRGSHTSNGCDSESTRNEMEEPLAIHVTASSLPSLEKAACMVQDLLETVRGEHRAFSSFLRPMRRSFEVGIENGPAFRVVRRLLGPDGTNMKHIAKESGGARLQIRGRGSTSSKMSQVIDSEGPLKLQLTATSMEVIDKAASMVEDLLESIREDYRKYVGSSHANGKCPYPRAAHKSPYCDTAKLAERAY